ncbi:MAG: hypothetical protein IPK99_02900 [Flavobacteriales bacterium]|nr:hypothetical protein [Flavobacteriales bacterium]
MKILTALSLTLATGACAQVSVDKPVQFTAADPAQRQVSGLGSPTQEDALIDLHTARIGSVHWAQAGGTAAAISLSMTPAAGAYRDGLRLRFIPAIANGATVTLNVDGLGAVPLVGPEGIAPPVGLLAPGRVAEVIYSDSVFTISARTTHGCPVGFLQANDRLCIQESEGANVSIFTAVQQCTAKGAAVCSWDEYIHACTLLSGQLTNLFNDWEWIDGTSDHTHTANQAGRYYCGQQRSIPAAEHPSAFARARCCYHLE